MSLNRKTYSPMSHTYSYSTTYSPTYSYSRVTTYLDALERDETISKLKRELTNVKSIEMKYYSLLQEISMAEKENRLLETKNSDLDQEYVGKIQETRNQTSKMEIDLKKLNERIDQEEKKVESVQQEIQSLLQELKEIKLQQETTQEQNIQLIQELQSCSKHITKLTQEQQQINTKKAALFNQSKQSTSEMQKSMQKLTKLAQMISNYEQELRILQSQSQQFDIEYQNLSTLCSKNTTMIQNLERKINIQEGQNQQLRTELNQLSCEWEKLKNKFQNDKESLYQNVIKVEECGVMLKQLLTDLDKNLETDSTEKKYLKDITAKHAGLQGQNQQMRQLLKQLQQTYSEKKTQQTALIEQVNQKLRCDQALKNGIQHRTQQLQKIKQRFLN